MEQGSPTTITRQFGERLRAVRRATAISLVAFASTVVGVMALPMPWPTVFAFAAFLSLVPLLIASRRYRCPSCGAVPSGDDGGQSLTPGKTCEECGVQLRA
jgi:hypothetical protein